MFILNRLHPRWSRCWLCGWARCVCCDVIVRCVRMCVMPEWCIYSDYAPSGFVFILHHCDMCEGQRQRWRQYSLENSSNRRLSRFYEILSPYTVFFRVIPGFVACWQAHRRSFSLYRLTVTPQKSTVCAGVVSYSLDVCVPFCIKVITLKMSFRQIMNHEKPFQAGHPHQNIIAMLGNVNVETRRHILLLQLNLQKWCYT